MPNLEFLNAPITRNLVLAFVIGVLSVVPSLAPSVNAINKNKKSCDILKKAKLEDKVLTLPLIYGIISVIVFFLVNKLAPQELRKYWFIGFIIGIIYPTMGWLSGLPQNVYGVKNPVKLYASAQILYLIFYGIIIAWVAANICKK